MDLSGKHILIVWDDPCAQYLSHWLEGQGAYSVVVLNTEKGFQRCQEFSYDILIVDVLACREFGWDFVKRLYSERGLSLPVLFIGHHNYDLLVGHGLLPREGCYMWVPGSVNAFGRVFGGFLNVLDRVKCSAFFLVDSGGSIKEGAEDLGHS